MTQQVLFSVHSHCSSSLLLVPLLSLRSRELDGDRETEAWAQSETSREKKWGYSSSPYPQNLFTSVYVSALPCRRGDFRRQKVQVLSSQVQVVVICVTSEPFDGSQRCPHTNLPKLQPWSLIECMGVLYETKMGI